MSQGRSQASRRAAACWRELDTGDRPLLVGFEPLEPGDPAYHREEIQLYWPFVGAEAWALGLHVASGAECDEVCGGVSG